MQKVFRFKPRFLGALSLRRSHLRGNKALVPPPQRLPPGASGGLRGPRRGEGRGSERPPGPPQRGRLPALWGRGRVGPPGAAGAGGVTARRPCSAWGRTQEGGRSADLRWWRLSPRILLELSDLQLVAFKLLFANDCRSSWRAVFLPVGTVLRRRLLERRPLTWVSPWPCCRGPWGPCVRPSAAHCSGHGDLRQPEPAPFLRPLAAPRLSSAVCLVPVCRGQSEVGSEPSGPGTGLSERQAEGPRQTAPVERSERRRVVWGWPGAPFGACGGPRVGRSAGSGLCPRLS